MAVLLLDPRFPDVLPFSVAKMEGTKVTYTAEVPVSVRWALCDSFPTVSDAVSYTHLTLPTILLV